MSKHKVLDTITCKFNIFDNGRAHSGIKRGYVLDNVKSAIQNPFVQERVKMREALGYLGHGFREMTGKLDIGEVEALSLGNGQKTIVKAIPACVTTGLDIDDAGNVTHTQDILDTAEGKTILGLHNSGVGGFSWASSGAKRGMNTLIDRIFGFDYVTSPNFAANRGYVLDSANGEETITEGAILDKITGSGVEPDEAKSILDSWWASAGLELQACQDNADVLESELVNTMAENEQLKTRLQQINDAAGSRETLIREFAENSAMGIDADMLLQATTATSPTDLEGLRTILDSASGLESVTSRIFGDGRQYSVSDGVWQKERQYRKSKTAVAPEPEYGSMGTVPDLPLY